MKHVHFLGNGYESIKQIVIEAETNGEAFAKAEAWYKETNQIFKYMCMEVW